MDFEQEWKKFAATWKSVVTQPETFFKEWNPGEPWREVVVFNLICGVIAGLVATVLTFGHAIGMIVLFPVFLLVGTVVGGVILFICFRVVGGTGDVEQTIRMAGYTNAVSVISMSVPFIGMLAGLYQLWLLIVGGRQVHGLDTTKAAIAVLIPMAILFALMLFGALVLGFGIAGFMMGR